MHKIVPPSFPDGSNHEAAEYDNEPTEHEKRSLRHVGESLPYAAWLIASVELCERAAFYGCQGLFQVCGSPIPHPDTNPPPELYPTSTRWLRRPRCAGSRPQRRHCTKSVFLILVICHTDRWGHSRGPVPWKIQDDRLVLLRVHGRPVRSVCDLPPNLTRLRRRYRRLHHSDHSHRRWHRGYQIQRRPPNRRPIH
jgi:hypothetical protein